MKTVDQNITIARVQREIREKLELPMDNLVFDFTQSDRGIQLNLITINPRHDQSFLFHTTQGKDKVEALLAMQEYVVQNFRQEGSYTVQWAAKGASQLHTSYFRARDMFDVLEKFYHGRERDAYKIFSITLNPIA